MSWAQLFTKKSVASIQQEYHQGELKKTLGPLNLVSLGVGAIIGAGIFVITGKAAATSAGPAVILSFAIAGVVCVFAGLCYAELASVLPVSGSAYTYSYATLGEIFAWIMGWLLLLEYGIAASTVAVGWSGYLTSFLSDYGVNVPAQLAQSTIQFTEQGFAATPNVNLVASLGILGVTALLTLGVRESASVNNVIVAIKVIVLLTFIAIGASFVNPQNWTPFVPPPTGKFGEFGVSGIFLAASTIFFAYVGFEAVSTAAGEAKNPQRDLPIGIIGSLLICTGLYVATTLVLTGVVPFRELNHPEPMAVAVDVMGIGWFSSAIKIGAVTGLSSVMLILCYAQTRVFYQMARDGLLPDTFGRIHPRLKTPASGTLILGIVIACAAGTLPLGILGDLVSLGTATAFLIVCVSVIYLRNHSPELHRPFRVPLGGFRIRGVWIGWTPLLGILGCIVLIAPLLTEKVTSALAGNPLPLMILLGYFAIGAAIYAFFGFHNSRITHPPANPGA